MKIKWKNILTVILPLLVVLGFFLTGMIRKDREYSMTERRVLAQMPELSSENLLSGKFMNTFETYMQDQFPWRDAFLGLKAAVSRYVFQQKDNHGYYLAEGYLSKLEYPMNESRLEASLKKQQGVYDTYLKDSDCKIYMSVIPDKNYFLAEKCGYPAMDYGAYVEKVKNGAAYSHYVDIFDALQLESFYRTDQHWKQECLKGVVQKLGDEMKVELETDFSYYKEEVVDMPFFGVYYSQAMLPVQADELHYLNHPELDACAVTSYNTGKPQAVKMYDMQKAYGEDPYEMFVSGSDALVVIENPSVKEARELVLFRDSFGSSLAPLLVKGYSKITLVDLRYIRSELLGQFLDFTDQDVLFLYSTLVF